MTLQEDGVTTQARLKAWPSPQDYNEAIQNPQCSFFDPELQKSVAESDQWGLPRPVSGAFASVYKMENGERRHAVRCFLHNISDQRERYEKISRFIMSDDLPYTVSFEFQEKGILIRGHWYPILKMDWVDGVTLEVYVEQCLEYPSLLVRLRKDFASMCLDLNAASIAHGDLQHGNIIVQPDGQLRLVDYDGVFVPEMRGWTSNELGHRNYQHPGRQATHFDIGLDNFASWVIYVSLFALSEDPSLHRELEAGSDCLLFRRRDFECPSLSRAFNLLSRHPNYVLRELTSSLGWILASHPLVSVPLGQKLSSVVTPDLSIDWKALSEVEGYPADATESETNSAESAKLIPVEPGNDLELALWWNTFLFTEAGPDVLPLPVDRALLQPAPRSIRTVNTDTYPIAAFFRLSVIALPILSVLLIARQSFLMALNWCVVLLPVVTIFYLQRSSLLLGQYFAIKFGKPFQGRILEKSMERRHRSQKYYLKIQFPMTRNGQIVLIDTTIETTQQQFNSLENGEPITVLFSSAMMGSVAVYEGAHYAAVEQSRH